jgi:H+/Cl- antiporter ClcA/CBS domain-containing protein
MSPTLGAEHVTQSSTLLERRDAFICLLAAILGIAAAGIAEVLVRAIALVTNISFYGEWSFTTRGPGGHHLGMFVILVPVIGGIIVGIMARFGSRAIRGHGIPEAMEQVLTNESKIPRRITFLKPISSAIAIGTGGPFGAEGPIIATGGALGSAIGQFIHMTANERKTLLAAGAAAGMTAIFNTPVASMLIAIELLLFEYRARSIVPVALAVAVAAGIRVASHGSEAVFAMPMLGAPTAWSSAVAIVAGGLIGVVSCYITRMVYWIEDMFEHLPVHWMWWPAIGAIAVGVMGVIEPHTLGVGYDNIEGALSGNIGLAALAGLCAAKLVSWSIALGSGTSGGTLAPLMTLGSGMGYLFAAGIAYIAPHAGIDPRVAALVGMTAMFAGASRALLASIAFALESTHQLANAFPIVTGVAIAYFASCLLMKTTIMTEKLARRGVQVAAEYDVDPLAQVFVGQLATRALQVLPSTATVGETLSRLAREGIQHQAYPVVRDGKLVGVVTMRSLLGSDVEARVEDLISRTPVVIRPDENGRAAATKMAVHGIGRLIVIDPNDRDVPIGIISRSDLIRGFSKQI